MTANINQKSLAYSTGTFSAYVACVKNGVWWEETGSNVRALPEMTDTGGDRETGENADLSTRHVERRFSRRHQRRGVRWSNTLASAHPINSPNLPQRKYAWGSGEEETAAEELVMGMCMLLFFPIKGVLRLPRSAGKSVQVHVDRAHRLLLEDCGCLRRVLCT